MIRHLLANSTPVTVIDKIFHRDELDDIYSDLPQARDLLRVKIGDIRDFAAMKDVMTDDVVGVVHLAAVSRVLWCLENQDDCWDVNERGTEVVLEALVDLNRQDRGKRWFILASSREVYGDVKIFPVLENSEKIPANVYGESKLRAETAVKRVLEKFKGDKAAGSLYTIALRLSNVYGGEYDHAERLIPSIVTQALSHQVIQIVGGKQHVSACGARWCLGTWSDLVSPSSIFSISMMSPRRLFSLYTSLHITDKNGPFNHPERSSMHSMSHLENLHRSTTSSTRLYDTPSPSPRFGTFAATIVSQMFTAEAQTRHGNNLDSVPPCPSKKGS